MHYGVYDKAKENDTCKLLASLGFNVTWIRIELEIKGSAADNFVNCLLMAGDDDFEAQSDILAQLTLGSLAKTADFGKRSASGHRSRFKRFKFWQTILDGVARLCLQTSWADFGNDNGVNELGRMGGLVIYRSDW